MKKTLMTAGAIIIILLLIIASQTFTLYGKDTSQSEVTDEIQKEDSISKDNLTILNEYYVDIDQDDDEELVKLYTSALRDSNGVVMWDDGQNWLLVVEDSDGDYVLFDGYVQLGKINVWIYKDTKLNEIHISTMQDGSASILLSDYIFDKEKNIFEKRIISNPKNVNLLFSSYE